MPEKELGGIDWKVKVCPKHMCNSGINGEG